MKPNQNIYQSARERAGLTQESASEQLYISTESLRMYETGRRRPSDEMAVMMAEVYREEALVYRHIKASPAGRVLPDLTERSLQECTIRLFRLLRQFVREQHVETLLEIAEDGIIDEQERPIYHQIMSDFGKSWKPSLQFRLPRKGKKKRPIGRQTDKAQERLEYTRT